MVPIVSIIGRSGSGKTTLLEKVVRELTSRGFRVGTIKHDVHGFEIDHEGKDSWRHRRAGAGAVVLSTGDGFALIKDVSEEWDPERLASSFLTDMDVVITEGYKKAHFPKIEVIRKARSIKPVSKRTDGLIAIVSDVKIKGRIPRFDLDDYSGVADLIEERIIKTGSAGAALIVDGRPVALKPFIEGLLTEAVTGMIKNLKGCENPGEIELRIRRQNP